MKRRPVPKRIRVRESQSGPRVRESQSGPPFIGGSAITRLEVSIKHGFLWIGGATGPCLVYITGKKTLHKIAAMLKAHAR